MDNVELMYQEIMEKFENKKDLSETVQKACSQNIRFTEPMLIEFGRIRKDYPNYQNETTIANFIVNFGYRFTFDEIEIMHNPIYKDDHEWYSLASQQAEYGFKFTFDQIIRLKNQTNSHKHTIAFLMASKGHSFTVNELKQLNEFGKIFNIIFEMAHHGFILSYKDMKDLCGINIVRSNAVQLVRDANYQFSYDQIRELFPSYMDSYVISKIVTNQALNGYPFTPDQVASIHDPESKYYRTTLSIIDAKHGNKYSFDDINRLKNPNDFFGTSLSHQCVMKTEFDVDQLLTLGNPADKEGDTVAHMMAKNGHLFSCEEILRLSNPQNYFGISIGQIMVEKGYQFSDDERKKLKIPEFVEKKDIHIDLKNYRLHPEIWFMSWGGELYINGVCTLRYEFDGNSIYIYNTERYNYFLNWYYETHRPDLVKENPGYVNTFPDGFINDLFNSKPKSLIETHINNI